MTRLKLFSGLGALVVALFAIELVSYFMELNPIFLLLLFIVLLYSSYVCIKKLTVVYKRVSPARKRATFIILNVVAIVFAATLIYFRQSAVMPDKWQDDRFMVLRSPQYPIGSKFYKHYFKLAERAFDLGYYRTASKFYREYRESLSFRSDNAYSLEVKLAHNRELAATLLLLRKLEDSNGITLIDEAAAEIDWLAERVGEGFF